MKATWAVACSVFMVLNIAAPLAAPVFAQDRKAAIVSPWSAAPVDNSVPGGGAVGRPGAGLPDNVSGLRPSGASAAGGKTDNSALPRKPIQRVKSPQSDTVYRIGPEDQLRISVWDNKELTLDLVVRPDGKISMPLLQDVVATGLTAAQLAENIQEGLSAYIVNPEVTVIVLQVNAPKYYIIGYVARPGTYPLRGDTSVLQALALAGGFTQFASPRGLKLIRGTKGKQEVRKINYYDLIESGDGNYFLRPGDTIVVP